MNYLSLIVTFVFLLFLFSTSHADELIIRLKSGNTIKVNFSGTIKGVEMISGSDSIENIHIITDLTIKEPAPSQEIYKTTRETKQTDTTKTEEKTKEKEQKSKDRELRFRIAPPIFGE